jgi:hypothetical protein
MTRVLLPPKPDTAPPGHWNEQRIRRLLRYTLWPQRKLAERVGVVTRAVEYWAVGTKTPKAQYRRMLDRIAEETGFFVAERRSPPMEYARKGETTRRWLFRKDRRRKGVYADLPWDAS